MDALSSRKLEILSLAARGLNDREIGTALGIAAHTVRLHLMDIRKRLAARNTTHAVAIALTQHLISLEAEHEEDDLGIDLFGGGDGARPGGPGLAVRGADRAGEHA